MSDIAELVESDFHEERFCGLAILTEQFNRSSDPLFRKKIYELFVKKIESGYVNNWDLIDVPGSRIGEYLLTLDEPLEILVKYARSKNLWIRRSAVIFTFPFIRIGEFQPTLQICRLLIKDKHDLIHKATGWALREVGKKDITSLRKFLNENVSLMPRTMLRYAIEKLPETERKRWLSSSK
jgi:3-methyladenine DNA glycosylase AlkD